MTLERYDELLQKVWTLEQQLAARPDLDIFDNMPTIPTYLLTKDPEWSRTHPAYLEQYEIYAELCTLWNTVEDKNERRRKFIDRYSIVRNNNVL